MDLVRQQRIDGCGVACLAMVTRTDYLNALGVIHPDKAQDSPTSHETRNERLIEELQRAGFEVNIRIRPDIRTLQNDAVLVVRYRVGAAMYMHCVVWSAEDQWVLDPFEGRPLEEYESGICLAFELSRSGPSGPTCFVPPA